MSKKKNNERKSTCLYCDTVFYYRPSRSTGKYCSNKCQGMYRVKTLYESGVYSWTTARKWFVINTEYKCASCGITDWNGSPLTLQIDHIDGNRDNNYIENLRYLCPNCHTQTDTWGVKNISVEGRKRLSNKNGAIV